MDVVGLGLVFILVGLFFFLTARLLVGVVPNLRPAANENLLPSGGSAPEGLEDAVLVVQRGGKVRSLNERARQVFHLQEPDPPDLDRLSRQTRPSEAFLGLCAAQGQAHFTVDGRYAEGTSYQLDLADDSLVLVSLRFPELVAGLTGVDSSASAQTLQTFTELTAAIAASLDLEQTLRAVLENMEKLVQADFLEITIWDAENQVLVPYHYTWVSNTERALEQQTTPYLPTEGYSGYLYRERSPLLVGDIETRVDPRPTEGRASGIRAYLGVPLLVGQEFVGTLELGSRTPDSFREEDLSAVQLISGQAAIALHNAMVYRQEQQRSAEMSGLSQMAQAFSSVRDMKTLFSRLVNTIAPMVRMQILGFLVYNEGTRTLEAQIPFHGLPDQIVELYRTTIPANSQVEQTMLDQDVLISEDASSDEQWEMLGLSFVAQAASLRETVLVPLNSGGHMLGYLQASNRQTGGSFTQSELHLLMIIANQTASIIENAYLVQQSRERAQRAEALRRIASLASSAANLDEILQFSLQELGRLLHAGVGAVFMVDHARTLLQMHLPSFYGEVPRVEEHHQRLLVDDPQYPFTVTDSQRPLRTDTVRGDQPIIPFYRNIIQTWMAQSIIVIPLVVRSEGIGEIWFTSQQESFFDNSDVQLVATAASQLAGAAEQMFLRNQTDATLRMRVDQLTGITRASREMSNTLELETLLKLVYDEALRLSGAGCGAVLLFDPKPPESGLPVIRQTFGDSHPTSLGMAEIEVFERNLPVRIADFEAEGRELPHPEVRSGLILPVFHRQRMAGQIILHHALPGYFEDSIVEVLQTLAVQAGISLGNAAQYQEQTHRSLLLKRELETLTELLRVSQMLRPSLPLEQSLVAIGGAIRPATPLPGNLLSVVDPESHILQRVVSAGLPREQWEELQQHHLAWSFVENLLQPQFRTGNVFYIPADLTPVIPPEVHTLEVVQAVAPGAPDSWDPDDFLLVPLYDSQNEPLGLISVDAPSDGRRPDRPTFEALEIFGIQAGLMIENHRRTSRLEEQVRVLESAQSRLEQSTVAAQKNLPVLLRKDLDQTISLQGLNQRVERIRALMEIAAQANALTEPGEIVRSLCQELLTRFSLHTGLIAEGGPGGVKLLEVMGAVPSGINPETLFGQRNPLRWILQEKPEENSALVVSSLENHPDWAANPLLNGLQAHSFLGMSLAGGANPMAVLVTGKRSLPPFTDEDRRIFEQLGRQISTRLQNIRLLTETQRRLDEVNLLLEFSLKLGSLQPDNILSVLLQSVREVLPQAQAGWVGLLDEQVGVVRPQVANGYVDDAAQLQIQYGLAEATGVLADEPRLLVKRVMRTGEPMRVAEIEFAYHYHLVSADLLSYRQATRGRLPISCMVLPLRLGEKVSGVLVLENFETPGGFSAEDEALAYSLTQQAALALDNARLYQAAESRALQLQNLTRASGRLSSSLNQDDLIAALLDLLYTVVPYKTATLWMRSGNTLGVLSARGFEDNSSRIGLSVAVEDSTLFTEITRTGESLAVADVRTDPRFPMMTEAENLSWLGQPLIVKGEVVGLLALENQEAGFYTAEHIQAAATFAGQAAGALENARLFEESVRRAGELDRRSQRLALLNRLSEELGASLDIGFIQKLTAQHLLSALNANNVACLMVGPGDTFILEVEVPPQAERLPVAVLDVPLFDRLKDSHGIFSTSDVSQEKDLAPMAVGYFAAREILSLLVVPLLTGSTLHGWMLVQKTNRHRFSVAEIEMARTVCNQAAIAIQNARLFDETRSLTEFLERRVEERTGELRREHQNSQTLLKVISELSTSLDMGLVLNRALAVINDSLGSHESLTLLLESTQPPVLTGEVLVESGQKTPSLELERAIARRMADERKPVVIDDITTDARWELPSGVVPGYRSALAAPLVMGEVVLGALMLFHREPGFFRGVQVDLVEATARQIAISINNAELFNLIRDQSEHLGNMLRDQQIEASRSRAILEAVADGVVVTNETGAVTLFNQSAERVLGLQTGQIVGQSLEQFSGIFGRSGSAWVRTIHNWSADPKSYQGEAFAAEFDLDNAHIIAVHLAPVFWRSQFLGTVSIFRDITHEVQVDRMKSEFVANVSHELRTPMTSIKGYVEIMLMGASGELNRQQRHFLEIVRSNTERLGVLVNDLLDISRIESGGVKLRLRELKMQEIAEEVIRDMERRCGEDHRRLQFGLEAPAHLPSVTGDEDRIRQVLINLVGNSYNYTPDGGKVTVKLSALDGHIQVDVQDTGIGVRLEDHERVFERFYRGEDALVLATAGTGLGLAVARTLIEMHHGRIWLSSSGVRGEGSTFSFVLPLRQDQISEV
ncbi:MAG TPA: GAF domain-containing protein [Anaerolinea sp.]|nr:GAF domain-containing protein [Anaerolinea sp.]